MMGQRVAAGPHARRLAAAICAPRLWPAARELRSGAGRPAPAAQPGRRQLVLGAEASASSLAGASEQGQGAAAAAARQDASGAACGSLEVIIGPMFAGKTSALLQRIAAHEALHLRVLAVKSDKDTRYGLGRLATHDGCSRVCVALGRLEELKQRWRAEYERAEVIAIDEGQFFPDLAAFCCAAADCDGKRVVVAGLDGDFRRERFGQMLDLIPKADAVAKLAARCAYCAADGREQPALFSLRIAADDRQQLVGGTDAYAPVCRRHYTQLNGLRRPAAAAAE